MKRIPIEIIIELQSLLQHTKEHHVIITKEIPVEITLDIISIFSVKLLYIIRSDFPPLFCQMRGQAKDSLNLPSNSISL